jgi:hypothetical protein
MAGFIAECPRLWQPQDDCAIDRERFFAINDGRLDFRARLQYGARMHRVETARVSLYLGPVEVLDQSAQSRERGDDAI